MDIDKSELSLCHSNIAASCTVLMGRTNYLDATRQRREQFKRKLSCQGEKRSVTEVITFNSKDKQQKYDTNENQILDSACIHPRHVV